MLLTFAEIDPALPVIFLDTGKHFGETLDYRDALVADLGLTDVRVIAPDQAALERLDPAWRLHKTDTDACCHIRKVEPLRAASRVSRLVHRPQALPGGDRRRCRRSKRSGPRIRINPLAAGPRRIADYMRAHALRENPLVAYGYLSIGCFPCTQPVKPGEDARSGRWAGQAKTECGIHLPGLDVTDAHRFNAASFRLAAGASNGGSQAYDPHPGYERSEPRR